MLNKKTKKVLRLILILFCLVGAVGLFLNRVKIRENWNQLQREKSLPPAQSYKESVNEIVVVEPTIKNNSATSKTEVSSVTAITASSSSTKKSELPEEINLAVPFVSQAPSKNWDAVHEETCEEASVVMINGFYKKEEYSRARMEEELQKLIAWQKENLGFFEDTTAEETALMMKEVYDLKAKVIYNVTIEDIKKELAAGRPVIIPAAGKLLPNPYFSNGGPIYHMLVLKGYTKDGKFISNDPGTNTLGENFTYKFADLYNAIHDWVKDGDILTGPKVMIVVE